MSNAEICTPEELAAMIAGAAAETSTTARALESSMGASFWIKKAALELADRDALDALRDAETLLQIARERAAAAGLRIEGGR